MHIIYLSQKRCTHFNKFSIKNIAINQLKSSFVLELLPLKMKLINRQSITVLRSKTVLSGEIFKENFIDIFQTNLEQVAFSLEFYKENSRNNCKTIFWKKLRSFLNRRLPYLTTKKIVSFYRFSHSSFCSAKTKNKLPLVARTNLRFVTLAPPGKNKLFYLSFHWRLKQIYSYGTLLSDKFAHTKLCFVSKSLQTKHSFVSRRKSSAYMTNQSKVLHAKLHFVNAYKDSLFFQIFYQSPYFLPYKKGLSKYKVSKKRKLCKKSKDKQIKRNCVRIRFRKKPEFCEQAYKDKSEVSCLQSEALLKEKELQNSTLPERYKKTTTSTFLNIKVGDYLSSGDKIGEKIFRKKKLDSIFLLDPQYKMALRPIQNCFLLKYFLSPLALTFALPKAPYFRYYESSYKYKSSYKSSICTCKDICTYQKAKNVQVPYKKPYIPIFALPEGAGGYATKNAYKASRTSCKTLPFQNSILTAKFFSSITVKKNEIAKEIKQICYKYKIWYNFWVYTTLCKKSTKFANTAKIKKQEKKKETTLLKKRTKPIILGSSGRVITISKTQLILQKTQPILFYNSANLHVKKGEWVKEGSPILTLTHQTLITGDIVQGIPRIEQLFEAFTSPPPAFKDKLAVTKFKDVHDTLHSQVRDIFRKHWLKNVLPIAVRKSLEEIQYILVEMIQKVYLSQGVLIADKHIEIIIRQIASKGQILDSGTTGLFLEEVLPIRQIENANLTTPGKKCLYVPAVMGLTAAALNSDSFISAASFQETTRVLSRDAIVGKSDFLRGLKEKVVIGDLISAGTGLDIYFIYTTILAL